MVKCAINKQNILIFNLRFMFYPKNVLSKIKSHIKVKITVVCLWNFDFKLDYKQSVVRNHIKLLHVYKSRRGFSKGTVLCGGY